MDRLGIIGGSAFLGESAPVNASVRRLDTGRGEVHAHVDEPLVFLRRHGHDTYRPPHRIPHHGHALAMESLGIRRVVGLCSVGSLREEIRPGTLVIPDDYLSFHPPPTFARDQRLHVVPALDDALRRLLQEVARASDALVHEGGVYAETRGPRFETRAEIRLLSDYAAVVGMTGASEATLFQERGIAYALLAVVDNYAHGLGDEPLTLEDFDERREENAGLAREIVQALRERAGSNARGVGQERGPG